MNFYFTVDVDLINNVTLENINEFELAFPVLKALLIKYPTLKTTWFIRLDNQLEDLFSNADYVFQKYAAEINWLRDKGHEIGWHYHAYKLQLGQWVQNTNDIEIAGQLMHYAPLAKQYDLQITRMGWGFHTNRTIAALDRLNFAIDSSAIPRPVYPWEQTTRDWSITSEALYYPSVADYRIAGNPSLNILEFPMSVCTLEAPGDTMTVKRYISPTYRPVYFQKAFNLLSNRGHLHTIMHPYEILQGNGKHELLSFDSHALELNLKFLIEQGVSFKTISDILKSDQVVAGQYKN